MQNQEQSGEKYKCEHYPTTYVQKEKFWWSYRGEAEEV
jgi:hypothetical protein